MVHLALMKSFRGEISPRTRMSMYSHRYVSKAQPKTTFVQGGDPDDV